MIGKRIKLAELDSEDFDLLNAAKMALNDSYAPYSKFNVGAACLLDTGEIIKGSNFENSSYPLCLCAERVALGAVHAAHSTKLVVKMAITAKGSGKLIDEPITPCGACRQVLLEYEQKQSEDIQLILQGQSGDVLILNTVKEILPLSFDAEFL